MPTQHDIFISHSSKDKELAEKIVDILLTNGCDVSANKILCTSLEGMKIPAGTGSFIEFLQGEIQSPKLVILLLTENYFASNFCVCELGASWGMKHPTFPLMVPPFSSSDLRATLKVAQAGSILEASYLDEFRDAVIERLGCSAKTPRWNLKRDEFLKVAPKIIKKLPKPEKVDRSELDEAKTNYDQAMEEIGANIEEIDSLNEQIEALKKCKNAKEVRAVVKAHSSSEKQFEALRKDAQNALGRVHGATYEALYQEARGSEYSPGREDDGVEVAIEAEEIREGNYGFIPDDSHPRVRNAASALGELRRFIDTLDPGDPFRDAVEEEGGYPLSFTNREFWNDYL